MANRPFQRYHKLVIIISYLIVVWICDSIFDLHSLCNARYQNQFDTVSYIQTWIDWQQQQMPNAIRPLGYPFFIGLFSYFKINTPEFFKAIAIVQLLLNVGMFLLLFDLLRYRIASRKALIICILFITNISFVIYAVHALTETLFTFCLVFFAWLLHEFQRTKKYRWLFITPSILSIATLVRPGLLYFTLLYGLVCLIYLLTQYRTLPTLIVFFISVMPICGQSLIMNKQYQSYKISMIDEVTVYRYLHTSIIAELTHQPIMQVMQYRDSVWLNQHQALPQSTYYTMLRTENKKNNHTLWQNHADKFITAFVGNLFSNFHTGNAMLRDINLSSPQKKWLQNKLFDYTRIWNMLSVICLLILCVQQLYMIIRRGSFNWTYILTAMAAYLWITSGISFFQGDRFNIVWMPLVAIILVFSFVKNVNRTVAN